MRKIRLLIYALIIITMLSGCVPTEVVQYCNEEVCYTKDEVDVVAKDIVNSEMDDLEDDFDYIGDEIDRLEALILSQANTKERTYDIIEVEIVSVNSNVYLVETLNLINADQYILISYNQVFEVGDKTHIASYYNGDVRLWNELKEFED